jgi:hypothetical protein
MVSTAASVNTGLRRNVRTANDRSCSGMAHPTSFLLLDFHFPVEARQGVSRAFERCPAKTHNAGGGAWIHVLVRAYRCA